MISSPNSTLTTSNFIQTRCSRFGCGKTECSRASPPCAFLSDVGTPSVNVQKKVPIESTAESPFKGKKTYLALDEIDPEEGYHSCHSSDSDEELLFTQQGGHFDIDEQEKSLLGDKKRNRYHVFYEDDETAAKKARKKCGKCGLFGHNTRTCKGAPATIVSTGERVRGGGAHRGRGYAQKVRATSGAGRGRGGATATGPTVGDYWPPKVPIYIPGLPSSLRTSLGLTNRRRGRPRGRGRADGRATSNQPEAPSTSNYPCGQ
ncbi:hypothetical protein LguiB_029029 [Lonicera macranthoides]